MTDEYAVLDATAQAELVRQRQVQPLDLVEAAIARLERLNPALNAVITPLVEQARSAAQSPALPAGPFRGVPFLLEDAFPPALTGPTGLGEALRIVTASDTAATLDAWGARIGRPLCPADVDPSVWARAELGRRYDAVQVQAAVRRLIAGVLRAPEWWASGYDLLVTPTVQHVTPRFAELTEERIGALFGLFTMPWSVTGQPALSLPLGWSADGLPIGMQLVADYGREDLLLRVASQLEAARPWAARRPPLHA